MEQAPDTIEDSVSFILSKVSLEAGTIHFELTLLQIEQSTKQHISGTFQFYSKGQGKEYAW